MQFLYLGWNKNKAIYLTYILSALVAFWYWHVDEHYQIFEFASYKLGFTPASNLAWEFHSQMRSAILPFIAFFVSKVLLILNCFHPYLPGVICRIISAIFFVYIYIKLIGYMQINEKTLSYKIAIFFWILPTVMVRFSPEAIGCSLFLFGFLMAENDKRKNKILDFFLIGIIWGLAFYIRMHIAILIGVYLLHQIYYNKLSSKKILLIFAGFCVSTLLEIILNYWLYNEIVWSPFNYYTENIIHNKANDFGNMAWHYYFFESTKNLFYPIGISLWAGVLWYTYKYPKKILTWLFWSFVIIHSMIGHKEYRFLFPVFPFFILMFLKSSEFITEKKYTNKLMRFLLILNLILLPSCFIIQSFKPLNWFQLYTLSKNYKIIYTNYPSPYALDTRFHNVRPYFWKHPSCKIRELKEINLHTITDVKICISTNDLGPQIEISKVRLTKTYQTIPSFINDRLSSGLKGSIDYLYVYKKL